MKHEQCIIVYTSMVFVDNESECTKHDSARENQYFSIKRERERETVCPEPKAP